MRQIVRRSTEVRRHKRGTQEGFDLLKNLLQPPFGSAFGDDFDARHTQSSLVARDSANGLIFCSYGGNSIKAQRLDQDKNRRRILQ